MNTKIRTRLERLEENDRTHRMGVLEQVGLEALATASNADLEIMEAFTNAVGRLGTTRRRRRPFCHATPPSAKPPH